MRKRRHRVVSAALWLCAVIVSTLASAESAGREGPKRPNIVFVLLDDVRYDDIVDHPFVQVPNIAQLAAAGATFTNAFTSAPLCSPSRAVFLTGQYPRHNGIIDNGERAAQSHRIVTFPRLLHEAGYKTGFFGKWHMGHEDDTARPGFDHWVSFIGQGVYFDPLLNIDGDTVRARGYMTDILTDHAVSFIESSPRNRPFLVFLAHKASHPEVHPNQVRSFPSPSRDQALYENAKLPRAPSWRAPLDGKPALARPRNISDPRSPEGGLPDEMVRGRLRMLSAVDRGIGRLRNALEKVGELDNTVFVITSDQGFFYGEFGLAQERRLAYEPSIRIPLIVKYPKIVRQGSRPTALISNVDIAPTMLDLAGVPAPSDMDGRSMVQVLKGSSREVRDSFLIEYYSDTEFPRIERMGYEAIRTARYKFIRYRDLKGMDELYDLRADPQEMKNLIADTRLAGVRVQLVRQLDELAKKRN